MPSTRRPPRQPDDRPEFFVDRDLGRDRFPAALRAMGFVVHTLFEVYPGVDQATKDPQWIKDSAAKGWVVFCRDKLRHPGERELVKKHGAKVFRVARKARTGAEQIQYVRNNINRIVQRARKPGPFIERVDEDRVERVWPRPPQR